MGRHHPVTSRRRVVAAAVAMAVLLTPLAAGAGPALASTGGTDWAAQAAGAQAAAAQIDLQIAGLAAQLQQSEAQATASDMAETQLQNELDLARADAGAMLAEAYVDAGPDSDVGIPAPYLDAARSVVYSVLGRYRQALTQVRVEQSGAHAELTRLEAIQSRLDDQKQSLDAIVGADRAEIERQQSADAAALALSDRARITATAHIGPISLSATEAQQKVMAEYPFGPLGGGGLPSGLTYTGTVVTGVASWYGPGFDGQPTATGAVYDEDGWTVASPWLPLGSFLVVSSGGRSVLLLVDDRGPYVPGRVLDLSHAAAVALGSDGLITVTAQVVAPAGPASA